MYNNLCVYINFWTFHLPSLATLGALMGILGVEFQGTPAKIPGRLMEVPGRLESVSSRFWRFRMGSRWVPGGFWISS